MLTRRAAALLGQGREDGQNSASSSHGQSQQQRQGSSSPSLAPSARPLGEFNGGTGSDRAPPPYIPLPEPLWELRRRFPSVTRTVLLQCIRCHRWVAQPVTKSPPQESEPEVTKEGEVTSLSIMKASNASGENESGEERDGEEEWRSPRLQLHYDKVVGYVKGNAGERSGKKKELCPYFIPNPAVFTCQWTYCELEDTWSDLRGKWLGELYAAMGSAKNDNEGGSRKNGGVGDQEERKRLNLQLSRELHGRRSGRLAGGLHGTAGTRGESTKVQECATESTHSGGMADRVDNLVRSDEAVLAAFCWITCDSCGKLRRVHQPFPGGAPFVCSLALNIGSCSVPEIDGVSAIFGSARGHSALNRKLAYRDGDAALRGAVKSDAAVSHAKARQGTAQNSIGSQGHHPNSLESSIPLLRSLTAAVRKRSLGGFIKNILTTPDEVRSKREEVMKASLDLAGEKPSDIPKQQLEVESIAMRPSDPTLKVDLGEPHKVKVEEDPAVQPKQTGERGKISAAPPGSARGGAEGANIGGDAAPKCSRRLGCPPRPVMRPLSNSAERHAATGNSAQGNLTTQPGAAPARIKAEGSIGSGVMGINSKPNANSGTDTGRTARPGSGREAGIESKSNSSDGHSSFSTGNSARCTRRQLKLTEMLAQVDSGKLPSPSSAVTGNVSKNKNDNRGAATANRSQASGHKASRRTDGNCSKVEEASTSEDEEGYEVTHWVCCDACDKWRVLSKKLPHGTKRWECTMRGDGTTCDDTDDEVKMNREEKRKKARKELKRRRT
ncbi:CW-type Zinc Finger [Trypanosoma brucei equiperdum]|uniref:CW-type Zinc Finger n=1 Tax=Trypanosoma brucei equiperdum TaxID=630700 RepID=A0A3L6L1Y9_9TRYP|nr:CW-type Zinc Finger [Trypanosoma brucei equiperdum]